MGALETIGLLMIAGLLLIMAETILPTVMLVGLVGGAFLVAAVAYGFAQDWVTGTVTLILSLGLIPAAMFAGVWVVGRIGLRRLDSPTVGKAYYLADEAASKLGITVRQLQGLIDAGKLRVVEIDGRQCYEGRAVEELAGTNLSLFEYLGQEGEALTPLRPSGKVVFDGKRVDCTSESGFLEEGTRVRVVDVRGTTLVVLAAEASAVA